VFICGLLFVGHEKYLVQGLNFIPHTGRTPSEFIRVPFILKSKGYRPVAPTWNTKIHRRYLGQALLMKVYFRDTVFIRGLLFVGYEKSLVHGH
jgi:hypothetical protein